MLRVEWEWNESARMTDESDNDSGSGNCGRKRLLYTVVLFLVAALAIDMLLDSASENKRLISQKLSDGRTIAVDGVTYGTNLVLDP